MKIKIRKTKSTEASLLTDLALESKAFWNYSTEFMDKCREELTITHKNITDPSFHYCVAEENNQILGFYAIEILDKSKAELDALFIYPKHIGKGHGKTLMNHAKKTAQDMGAKTLLIQGEPNAEGFYLASGARQTGKKESGSIPGRFLPIFEIEL